jgi:hypothetical protein
MSNNFRKYPQTKARRIYKDFKVLKFKDIQRPQVLYEPCIVYNSRLRIIDQNWYNLNFIELLRLWASENAFFQK